MCSITAANTSARASTSVASTPTRISSMRRRSGSRRASRTASATGRACRSTARSCATASRARRRPALSTGGSSMSEAPVESGSTRTAGGMLREARLAQGMHIGALAATIKVTQRKLEALEADRLDELPDATFTRALAQTVCRALKIDPTAVLTLLPPPGGHRLEQVGEGLNAPFRERPGVGAQREANGGGLGAVFWITVLILAASLGLYFLPAGWFSLAAWNRLATKPAN